MYIMSLTEIKNAVVLFSGGLDSTTCIAIAKEQGFECYALTIDYGQSHVAEVNAAERIVKVMQVKEHKTIKMMSTFLCLSIQAMAIFPSLMCRQEIRYFCQLHWLMLKF
jgi:7-cyano-7-deazaguanine synthase in queuosine biosynthesis